MNKKTHSNLSSDLKIFLLRGIALIRPQRLELISRLANMSVGRGFGATTFELEVKTIHNFSLSHGIKIEKIFDIGANIGLYSEELRKYFPESRIYAFEPSSASSIKFQERFMDDEKIFLVRSAVGKSNGESVLYSDYESSGLASLTSRRLDHFGIKFENSERISILTLDQWCQENHVLPDLIKIDVEGHELDVLEGAQNLIREVSLIQFEFGGCNIDTRTFFQDFFYFFKNINFDLYRITPNGLQKITKYAEEDEYFVTTNYLALNSELKTRG